MGIKQSVTVVVAAMALAGCSSKLKCHDKTTADVMERLVLDNAAKESSPDAVSTLIGNAHIVLSQTIEKSRSESGAIECTGVLTADLSKAAITPDQVAKGLNAANPYLDLIRQYNAAMGRNNDKADKLADVRANMPTITAPGVVAWNVVYDVQRTSDNKDVFVNLMAGSPIITYVAYYAKTNETALKSGAGKSAPAATPAAPAADTSTSEGEYTNGQVTISDELGNRGGDELSSSLCKGQVFKPNYQADSGRLSAEDGSYVIDFLGDPVHMEIEGTNRCFPEGRYRKVK